MLFQSCAVGKWGPTAQLPALDLGTGQETFPWLRLPPKAGLSQPGEGMLSRVVSLPQLPSVFAAEPLL